MQYKKRSQINNFQEEKKMKMLVAYDGSIQSKDALMYGLQKARQEGGEPG